MALPPASLYSAVVSNPAQLGARPEDAEQKKHHLKGGKGFVNPWDSYQDLSPFGFFRTMLWRKLTRQTHTPTIPPRTPIPQSTPSFHPTRHTPSLRATWLGHACTYLEFPTGLRVLLDPVFESHCAPLPLPNLKRYTPPPCQIEDIPFVDIVAISHNHYDHLSYESVKRIKRRWPGVLFFVPLGVGKWFKGWGIREGVVELDWWEGRDVTLRKNSSNNDGGVSVVQEGERDKSREADSSGQQEQDVITATISALPCQHVSARGPFDRCQTLWASWSIESGGKKVWFAGDTGYRTIPLSPSTPPTPKHHLPTCPAFTAIGHHRGPFDLGLIPIGAYAPREVFSNVHADPEDAVAIFKDTRCKRALGIHWGTWVLTEEEGDEPPRGLRGALRAVGVAERGVFDVVGLGGVWVEGGLEGE